MSEDDNGNGKYKTLKFLGLGVILLALLWLNYCHFNKHIASNPERISNFIVEDNNMDKFRAPAVAGLFYPANADSLASEVNMYLDSARAAPTSKPQILVVPHAGYMYSAATAAQAYRLLEPYKNTIHNVILVGPSHHVAVKGFALSKDDYFTTPLGKVSLNHSINAELDTQPGFHYNNAAHLKEHSLEVQLPFLQRVLKNFSIVPIVYNNAQPQELAIALEPYLNRADTIIIFSADLSHYYKYDEAIVLDSQTKDLVENKQAAVEDHMSCGSVGINTAILLAKANHLYPKLLEMVNSGDVTGDKDNVVGYGAWAFNEEAAKMVDAAPMSKIEQEIESLRNYANVYGKDLLKIAQTSIEEAALRNKHFSPNREDYANPLFNKGAAFVTLEKNNELRGCIGTLFANQAVAYDVAQNSYAAAMEDNRFSPLKPEELKEIKISISLLSGFEPIEYSNEQNLLSQLVQGVDGLVIRDGNRQGLFLPSVWSQMKDKQEFLNNLKLKAGMSPSFWSNRIKAYRFRVVEISKNEN